MKFRHKIFLGTLIFFMLAFNAGAFYLTSHFYEFSRQMETDSGIREHDVILSSITSRIENAERFYPDAPTSKERLAAVIRPLAEYYEPQGVLLALYNENDEVYADMPGIEAELLNLQNTQSKNVMEQPIGDDRHVLIASRLPEYPHITFVYARNIAQIDAFRADAGRVFVILNAAVLVFLGICVFILLKHLTKPITELKNTAAEIAGGAYEKRAYTDGSDELGVLADSFNRMADSVEAQMALLVKSAEDKQQFVDDLTHEMRTPLTSIIGYSDYLLGAKSTEAERLTAAGHLHKMATRLKNLSDKLMDMTYLRSDKIEMKPVNAASFFSDLEIASLPILRTRMITLNVKSRIQQIFGDETLLLSVLLNLVENAAKASEDGGVVEVNAYNETDAVADGMHDETGFRKFRAAAESGAIDLSKKGEAGVIIEVTDTGHGMSQEEAERITAPFYRVDKSRSREHGGVGLGLSIVAKIIELHNAKLEIISEQGKGTTVRICLPD